MRAFLMYDQLQWGPLAQASASIPTARHVRPTVSHHGATDCARWPYHTTRPQGDSDVPSITPEVPQHCGDSSRADSHCIHPLIPYMV